MSLDDKFPLVTVYCRVSVDEGSTEEFEIAKKYYDEVLTPPKDRDPAKVYEEGVNADGQ